MDPTGAARLLTGHDGSYTLQTIKPGPYPWKNHRTAWRPDVLPGDPPFALDPIYTAFRIARAVLAESDL